jgi:hypothetical protein
MRQRRIRTEVPSRPLSVSHRKRLIEELRSDPHLAAEYLRAAAEDGDPRVYLAAQRTVIRALQTAAGHRWLVYSICEKIASQAIYLK